MALCRRCREAFVQCKCVAAKAPAPPKRPA